MSKEPSAWPASSLEREQLLAHERYRDRQRLTVGDGFRIGLGMFLFQLCIFGILIALVLGAKAFAPFVFGFLQDIINR